ncbi:MAG: hypothetical protein ACT4OI_01870 [Methanobacteriota archaeon]
MRARVVAMGLPHRAGVVVLVLLLAVASVTAVAPRAAAAQGRPTWTQGDFWTYTRTAGGEASTVRVEVRERTTLTLSSGSYGVWHVSTTTTDGTGNATVTHAWIQDANLGIAKANFSTIFGEVQVTFDPPWVQAAFPLTVNAQWSLNTTIRLVDIAFPPIPLTYSALVTAEQDTSVPAGTFRVAVIRTPSTAGSTDPREESHYSDGAGNSVREESYDSSGNRVSNQELVSYRYQSGSGLILLIVGGVIGALFVLGAVVTIRRRRAAMMGRGGYPPRPPPTPPEQPPQGPPPGM